MKLYLILFLCCIASLGKTQPYHHIKFNIGDDLDCNEIYYLFEDSHCNIWIGTNNGAIKYDGINFKRFNITDGMANNQVYRIGEFENGVIWFSSFEKITFFDGHNMKPFYFNSTLAKMTNPRIQRIDFIRDSTFLLNSESLGIIKIEGKNYKKEATLPPEKAFICLEKKLMQTQIDVFFMGKNLTFKNQEVPPNSPPFVCLEIDDSSSIFIYDKNAYFIDMNNLNITDIKQTKSRWVSLFKNSNNNIWLASLSDGIYKYNPTTYELTPHQIDILENKRISSFTQSSDGGYWVSTVSDGLYYFPNFDILSISDSRVNNKEIKKIYSNGKKVFLATNNTFLGEFCSSNRLQTIADFNSEFRDFAFNQHNELISVSKDYRVFNHSTKSKIDFLNHFYRKILFLKDGMYGISKYYVNYMKKGTIKETPLFHDVEFNPWSILKKNDTEFLIGSNSGLWLFNTINHKLTKIKTKSSELSASVKNISSGLGMTILSTTKGIRIEKGDKVIHVDKSNGLIDNICNHVLISPDSTVYVSTNKGLSIITHILDSRRRKILNLNMTNGLNSNLINSTCELNDTIYCATAAGVNYFNKNLNLIQYPPPLFIDSIVINQTSRKISDQYHLKSNENSIRIDFHTVSFRGEKKLYKYRILSIDTTWKTTSDHFLILSSLSPGNYPLEIKSIDQPHNTESTIRKINFFIDKPIYQKGWFIASFFLLFFLLFYLVFRYQIRQVRTKSQLKNEIVNIRQQALSAQMNPHFIFNSLNSIQSFILKNDKKGSNKYLAQFSKLMRLVLENSKNQLIPVQKEIEALEIYLALEVLRFKDKVSFEINIEPSIDLDSYKIPPLLLQPFIENAVWHGIMHKEGNGKITVLFKKQTNHLICIIEDDGIGRKNRKEIKTNNKVAHKSAGMDVTSQRIELGKKLFGQDFSFFIHDLVDENNKSIGTRVEIVIPKTTNK